MNYSYEKTRAILSILLNKQNHPIKINMPAVLCLWLLPQTLQASRFPMTPVQYLDLF